jgi:hypothetical protein
MFLFNRGWKLKLYGSRKQVYPCYERRTCRFTFWPVLFACTLVWQLQYTWSVLCAVFSFLISIFLRALLIKDLIVMPAIAVLWIDFVREIRWCWEESERLPRMKSSSTIDLSSCLIHQKLQMVTSILFPCL